MRFGLFGGATVRGTTMPGDSARDYLEFIDYVCEAEAYGFHGVFLVEHHFTGFNQVSASLNLLAYLAAKTSRIRLGTAVTVLPWHNPVLVAEQAATVDLLSNGRLDFGIGRGYRFSEFKGFCVPLTEAQERYDEVLEVIRKAWTSPGRFSHHGKRWHFDDIVVEPSPVQRPHPPFWIGAGTPAVLETAGTLGLNLLLDQLAEPEVIGQRVAIYRAAVEATGRAFDPMSIGVTRSLCLARDAHERERQIAARGTFLEHVRQLTVNPHQVTSLAVPQSLQEARGATERAAILGTPAEIIRRLKQLEALGVQYVLLMDFGLSRSHLRVFAEEVMPAFARTTPPERHASAAVR
jgi:alkanesulfonate monooxygenase SsuD/methylene tetrahydromethanopterin reductase-like flavin-dependent oxidoreductase (luciferase family)